MAEGIKAVELSAFSRSDTSSLIRSVAEIFDCEQPEPPNPHPPTVKPALLSLTDGGSTFIPSRPHSAIYAATLLLPSSTLVRSAAKYSLGIMAFKIGGLIRNHRIAAACALLKA